MTELRAKPAQTMSVQLEHWKKKQALSRSHTRLLLAENLQLFDTSGAGKSHLAKPSCELPALIQKWITTTC